MSLHTPATDRSVPLSALPPLRTRSRADVILPVLIMAITAAAMLANLSNWPRYEDDEGTYTGQAGAVLDGSITPYTYTYDHPFLGWLQLAPFKAVFDGLGFDAGSSIYSARLGIVVYGAVTAALIYLLARRFGVRPLYAAIGPAIWITSALTMEAGRMVFLDNIAVPWILLAFYLALSHRQHLWHYLGAGVAFGIAAQSKETVVVLAPALLYAMWTSSWPRLRVMHTVVFLVTAILTTFQYLLFAALKGELFPSPDRSSLIGMLTWQLSSRDGSGSFFDPGSDRRAVVEGWLFYDKWFLVIGVAAAAACLLRRSTRVLGITVALSAVPVVLMGGYLPSMYYLVVLPFLAVSIAVTAGGAAGWAARGTRVRWVLAAASAVTVVAVLAGTVGPDRWQRLESTWTGSASTDFYQARAWALDNIPEGSTIITNGELWNDFRDNGWTPEEVVPFTKVDRDPDFIDLDPEWIVMTPTMRRDVENDPQAAKVQRYIDSSTTTAEFGEYTIMRVGSTEQNVR